MPRRTTRASDDAAAIMRSRTEGLQLMARHPVLAPLAGRARWHAMHPGNLCPPSGWAVVASTGTVHLNPDRHAGPEEWAWVGAHCLIHLGFGHTLWRADWDRAWNLACCLTVNQFVARMGIGTPPPRLAVATGYDAIAEASRTEESCAQRLRDLRTDLVLHTSGTGGADGDLRWAAAAEQQPRPGPVSVWAELLATGLAYAAGEAVGTAGGVSRSRKTSWQLALDWFVSSYPLLGAIAGAFTLVQDADMCRAHQIRVAAISPAAAELYVSPLSGLLAGEQRFVIGHELLHAGLRHDTRCAWRDRYLWNVACDYVINGWLAEMNVGDMPAIALYDPALRGLSAEEVYDKIVTGRRRLRKIATLRGVGLADVLPAPLPRGPDDPVRGVDLDEFYRRSLTDGLAASQAAGRGLLPAGLIEEIRALAHPPVPWDVELARWFDHQFPALERHRTYARASRRQQATPDIPRPGRRPPDTEQRTFGVVLDTSGSMDTRLLGKALGAIASYAVARDVPSVRVVFCDAQAHDNGWMHPADIAGRVRVRGRGGTVLQPGVNLLQQALDFPPGGPLLIITDGMCDHVRAEREHAFLIPADAALPFRPRGPVFRFR